MRTVALVGTNSGNMLNLVTNDTQKILDASMYAHFGKTTFSTFARYFVCSVWEKEKNENWKKLTTT